MSLLFFNTRTYTLLCKTTSKLSSFNTPLLSNSINTNSATFLSSTFKCAINSRSESTSSSSSQANPSNLFLTQNEGKNEKAENISRAMAYYLQKLTERESLIKLKSEEYEIGKRHLAKMMGENPETFMQNDIDRAIEYLLPSNLYAKKARPFLKHPTDYYPKSKMASFDKDGRPYHSMFYTKNPEFNQIIYDITEKLFELKKLEDTLTMVKSVMIVKKNKKDDKLDSKIDLTGFDWITQSELSKKLNTQINEYEFAKFSVLIKKLADHPLSSRQQEFIQQFLIPFKPPVQLSNIPALLEDEKGRKYQQVETYQRTAHVKLKLYEGTGDIKIKSPEGEFNILYFESLTHREQLLFPFKVVDRINKFDMDIEINKGGMSCLAKAIRYATSKALCSFVSADNIEKLRLSGLLTQDIRLKERKKPGQEGARRKYKWLKR